MPLNLAISIFVVLCGVCFVAAVFLYINAKELHSRSMEILDIALDCLARSEDEKAED